MNLQIINLKNLCFSKTLSKPVFYKFNTSLASIISSGNAKYQISYWIFLNTLSKINFISLPWVKLREKIARSLLTLYLLLTSA